MRISSKKNMMRAAIIRKFNEPISVENIPIPQPCEKDVLVRIRGSGLCGSDLHILDGQVPTVRLPYTPGHELAGEVAQIGSRVKEFSIGDHVISTIDVTCGACRFCLTGRSNLCKDLRRIGFELNGSHAEYAVVPANNLVKVADHVPFEKAAIIPDAVSCMLHAIKVQGKVKIGHKVILLGIGGLGMQGLQIAKLTGAEVYCTSRRDEKLKTALELGADVVINTNKQNLFAEVDKLTGGEGCDVVLDNIGTNESVGQALGLCCRGGKVIIVGFSEHKFSSDLYNLMIQEKEIIGTRASTKQDLIEAVRLVEQGKIHPYVSDTFSLEEIHEALDRLRKGKIMGRGVLLF